MKRASVVMACLALFLYLGASSAYAQRGGRGGGAGMGRGGGMGAGAGQGVGRPDVGPGPSSDRGNPGARGDHGKMSADRGQGHADSHTATDQLERHPKLASRLESQLPAGTNLNNAAQGFKNLGQFVAAVHVSKNLGIPFSDLKARMTGDSPMKLGKAIQELRPDVDAKAEAKKAEKQARNDLEGSKD